MKIEIKERIDKIKNKEIPEGYRKTNIGIFPSLWEIKKINQISEQVRETSIKENLPILTISAGNGFLDQKERFNKIIAGKSLEKYTYLKKDDFSYNRGNSKSYKYGCLYKLQEFEEALVPNVYHSFRLKEVNTDYYKYLFESKFLDRQLRTLISSTARMDGLLNINRNEFMSLKLLIPPIEEQEKISIILSKWDEGITNQEKLIEAKKKYKKGMMQKIFSQELRFKDENGNDYPEWEEKRLGEIFEHRSERGFENLELLSVTISDGIKKRTDIEGKDNSSKDKSNYKKVYKQDIVYNSMRMWQGASGISLYDGIVSPAYTVLKGSVFNSSTYFSYLFKMTRMINIFQRNSQGLTSDTWNLKYPQLSLIKITCPSLMEQEKIANFLSTIDREIELLERELYILKNEKQNLMSMLLNGVVRTV